MLEGNEYERKRLQRIRDNEEMLKQLGLHLHKLTAPAPVTHRRKRTIRKRSPPEAPHASMVRRSARLDSNRCRDHSPPAAALPNSLSVVRARKRPKVCKSGQLAAPPSNPRSSKLLTADIERMHSSWLGRVIPPLGGQVKRAVMEELSGEGSPTFSRMSGIQEWRNAIALFVNYGLMWTTQSVESRFNLCPHISPKVYGEGYKNVFLRNGQDITWFAQPRQREDTPVIQRLVRSEGGVFEELEDGRVEYVTVSPTPVLLFCRELGQGYVYCGRLNYGGHDPTRVPLRFVWELAEFRELRNNPPFRSLVKACNKLFGGTRVG